MGVRRIISGLFPRYPEYHPRGARVVTAEIAEGYIPPSASMDPAATVEGD